MDSLLDIQVDKLSCDEIAGVQSKRDKVALVTLNIVLQGKANIDPGFRGKV